MVQNWFDSTEKEADYGPWMWTFRETVIFQSLPHVGSYLYAFFYSGHQDVNR